jgi:uncharacterized membrane protein SirB2
MQWLLRFVNIIIFILFYVSILKKKRKKKKKEKDFIQIDLFILIQSLEPIYVQNT